MLVATPRCTVTIEKAVREKHAYIPQEYLLHARSPTTFVPPPSCTHHNASYQVSDIAAPVGLLSTRLTKRYPKNETVIRPSAHATRGERNYDDRTERDAASYGSHLMDTIGMSFLAIYLCFSHGILCAPPLTETLICQHQRWVILRVFRWVRGGYLPERSGHAVRSRFVLASQGRQGPREVLGARQHCRPHIASAHRDLTSLDRRDRT